MSATITGTIDSRVTGGGGAAAGATYDLYLYELVGTVHVTSHVSLNVAGSELTVSYASFDLDLECGGREVEHEVDADAGAGTADQARDKSFGETFEADGDSDCSFFMGASLGAATNRPAPGEAGAAKMTFELRISTNAEPAGCSGVHGTVRDGAEDDGHQNPLPGVRVELRNETSRVGDPVVADETGEYCIDDVDPGTYKVRSTLVDDTYDPPLFETKHADGTTVNWVEVPVTAESFGPEPTTDVAFTDSASNTIADMANIHWQSERFVRWLTTTARISPAAIGPFTILTFDDGTHYRRSTREVSISAATTATDDSDSRFRDRDNSNDEGPENIQWHEIGHHLSHAVGLGRGSAAGCGESENHGGWSNASTCDSLHEAFASWIATVASLDLDAGRGAGYADPVYSVFNSLEENDWRPWSSVASGGETSWVEERAVRELLWDLADDTPADQQQILIGGAADGSDHIHMGSDRVALQGVNLLLLIAQIRPATVDDLLLGLVDSPLVAANLKVPDRDVDQDGVMDLSPLAEAFLMHGFHPFRDDGQAPYLWGDPIGRTDRPASEEIGASLVERRHESRLPGASIRLRNPSASDMTVVIELAGEDVAERRTYLVPATSEEVVYLEPPPYWDMSRLWTELPPCDAADAPRVVDITVSVDGVALTSLDSCAYFKAMAAATDGFALDLILAAGASAAPAGGPNPIPSGTPGAPSPALIITAGAVIAVIAVIALGILLRFRRRRQSA